MRSSKFVLVAFFVLLLGVAGCFAQAQPEPSALPGPALTVPQVVDHFLAREAELVSSMRQFHPVVETYLQDVKPDRDLGSVPAGDKYFLGRLDSSDGIEERFYDAGTKGGILQALTKPVRQVYSMDLSPVGFANMIFIDRGRFDRNHYYFKFLRREFLGQVRTLVFEVVPKEKAGEGLFSGRIWVEDLDYNIVRFNGTYANAPRGKHYFHMDSWRTNVRPGLWLPTYVYSEESDLHYSFDRTLRFKAQTRLWGYDLKAAGGQEEFTQMVIDNPNVKDQAPSQQDSSPVLATREWEREAEDNVLDRLEKAGLLAPPGDVDKVLETVVNNLEITNDLDIQPAVRCRVMLTTPMESYTVGHTIVVSRGLLDVLPDEATLAMVLAHELGHIALGDQMDTKFAFADQMNIADEASFGQFRFHRDGLDEKAADARAIELLQKSPYQDKLKSVGLFLRMLEQRAPHMPNLITARIGNGLTESGNLVRMAQLVGDAPELEMDRLTQIPALPLGGRIQLDPWNDSVQLIKAQPVPLLSAKEKMPFQVTQVTPYLVRLAPAPDAASASGIGHSGK